METKEAYKAKFEAQIEQAQAKLLALKASAKEMTADGKIAASKQLEAFEHGLVDAKAKLAELAQVGEDKWADFKGGLEGAWASLTDLFTAAGDAQPKQTDKEQQDPTREQQQDK